METKSHLQKKLFLFVYIILSPCLQSFTFTPSTYQQKIKWVSHHRLITRDKHFPTLVDFCFLIYLLTSSSHHFILLNSRIQTDQWSSRVCPRSTFSTGEPKTVALQNVKLPFYFPHHDSNLESQHHCLAFGIGSRRAEIIRFLLGLRAESQNNPAIEICVWRGIPSASRSFERDIKEVSANSHPLVHTLFGRS